MTDLRDAVIGIHEPDYVWQRLCTRTELWAAIIELDTTAERYGLGLELDSPDDLARSRSERDAARDAVRALLGMEAES